MDIQQKSTGKSRTVCKFNLIINNQKNTIMKTKTLLLSVSYTDGRAVNGKGGFWAESTIKNMPIKLKENETIHDAVKRALEEKDFVELCYKGKPQADMFVDTATGTKITGYIYRTKHMIEDRHNNYSGYAYFDAWVSIKVYCEDENELESCTKY
jgi:hypothetical protein